MPPSEPNGALGRGTSTGSTFNTLSFQVVKPKGKKRQQFDPTRRREVKDVRKLRACLRCSLLRIRCSSGDLCTSCKGLVLHTHEKLTLSFSGCIRTRLVEVSVFEPDIPPVGVRDTVLLKTKSLALKSITLNFASQITWNLPALVDDVFDWLKLLNSPQISSTSKVGILSSPNFMELIEPHVGFEKMVIFQRMLYAESLAYIQPIAKDHHDLSLRELQQIGAVTGHSFLKFLDDKLRPQSLKHCSKEALQALFLLVVGTILAAGYTVPVVDSSESFKNESDNGVQVHQAQLQAMQEHLCQILAHYVVYLGSQLSLQIHSDVEQFVLESAAARWKKQGTFEWLATPRDELEPRESPDVGTDLSTNCLDSLSDLYFGDPHFSHKTACQPLFVSFPAMGSPESTSRLFPGQNPRSRLPFGRAENQNIVQHNSPRLRSYQPTLSISKAALESFDHWNSKWDGHISDCAVQMNGCAESSYDWSSKRNNLSRHDATCDGFVVGGSWGVIRDTLPVNLDVEHNAEAEVDNLEFASKANDEGHTPTKIKRSELDRLKKKVTLLV